MRPSELEVNQAGPSETPLPTNLLYKVRHNTFKRPPRRACPTHAQRHAAHASRGVMAPRVPHHRRACARGAGLAWLAGWLACMLNLTGWLAGFLTCFLTCFLTQARLALAWLGWLGWLAWLAGAPCPYPCRLERIQGAAPLSILSVWE